MILSHEHEFVFFRTRKTAGTSVETALAPFCGSSDYISRGAARSAEELGSGSTEHRSLVPLRAYRPWTVKKLVARRKLPRVWNHMEAAQIRPMLSAAQWSRYTKFTVVRNPYDSVISFYFWKNRDLPEARRPTVSEYLRSPDIQELTWNWRTFSIGDRVVADHVCRYETLAEDLRKVGDVIGLPDALDLPRAKGGTRADHRDPREVLSAADIAVVQRLFAREIETFGYTL